MSHTPGPWIAEFSESGGYDCMTDAWDVWAGERQLIAEIDLRCYGQTPYEDSSEVSFKSETAEANARLIAAAPELLAALKALLEGRPELWGDEVRNGITSFPIEEAALDAADQAIEKAEGV